MQSGECLTSCIYIIVAYVIEAIEHPDSKPESAYWTASALFACWLPAEAGTPLNPDFPIGKSENPPWPVSALSLKPQIWTKQALSLVACIC